ncbi:RNA-binding S4 domain-containing protein [Corynebacterium choanae]|uniref:Ribosome-associated protein n=1 Tax=Corynebacterium choanae TaxID=1862358 RepID=A0A3G6JA52_9CORY|nr:RNA-binding S4 domain-containing protein [Corynebacterium choanae]AZA14663.1 ribosome-associated protein [Corynebacterium choanae]
MTSIRIEVPIADETIKLGQLLKLANFVDTGSEAKQVLAEGLVSVNGDVDTRRGRTLHVGDEVGFQGSTAIVVADDDDDYFDEATAGDDFDPERWRNVTFE